MPACVTTVAVNSSFVNCWEGGNSCWDIHSTSPSDILAPWTVGTYPDDGSGTCSCGKSLMLVLQPARSVASPDTANLCRHGGGCLQPCWNRSWHPPFEWAMQWAEGWAQGYLWHKAFCSGRFWFSLFFNVLQNNRRTEKKVYLFLYLMHWTSVSIFDAVDKFLVVSLYQRKANCQEAMEKDLKILDISENRSISAERYLHHVSDSIWCSTRELRSQGSTRAAWSVTAPLNSSSLYKKIKSDTHHLCVIWTHTSRVTYII